MDGNTFLFLALVLYLIWHIADLWSDRNKEK
jgi:hypothetical protein